MLAARAFAWIAEAIRDQALAVSGLLNDEIGGPSVYPVQPANLWKEIGFLRPEIGMDEWPLSEGPDLYRRGVYTFWRRVCTYPTFSTFDAPSRDVCVARVPGPTRPCRRSPALNEPPLRSRQSTCANASAAAGGSILEKRIEFGFRLCVARDASTDEQDRLTAFFEQQRQSFQIRPRRREALIRTGSPDGAKALDPAGLAAWTMVANVLLNLDETLTKG